MAVYINDQKCKLTRLLQAKVELGSGGVNLQAEIPNIY